jgi:2-deoxy-D-gluconate 3-dehydrogenase
MPTILDKFALKGQTALVTGGAGLLGKQFTRALGQAGANVVVADTDLKAAKAHAQELMADGIMAMAVEVDVRKPHSVTAMVHKTVDAYQRLNILVNSAAIDPKFDPDNVEDQFSNAFEDYALKSWQRSMDVNLTGAFLASQAAARQMVKQGSGVMINICSIYGLVGPDQRIYPEIRGERQFKPVDYSVTKAGILGLTRYLAAYYRGQHIRVNALTPGGVYHQHEEAFTTHYADKVILGRMAEIDEMNGALLFLASDASQYMTGANLIVDGGYTAW